jgi:protein SCO1/2
MTRPLLASALLALLTSFSSGRALAQAAPDMEILPPPPKDVGFDQNIGRDVPLDAIFQDETGKKVHLGDSFGDKPVVLQLAYDTCPMLCSLTAQGLVSSLKAINLEVGVDFNVVTLSFDPRDTPERSRTKKVAAMARYGRSAGERGWHFLTGDETEIKKVTSAVGFRYVWDAPSQQYAHPAGVVVLTPKGTIARYLFGIEYASKDLRLALVESSKGNVGTVVDQLLLLCYHYDPKVGKYGATALGAMRAGGALTLLLVGGMVFVLSRRDRRAHDKEGS